MIIEKTENGIYKMLDLSELPKKRWKNGEVIDWLNLTGVYKVKFQIHEKRDWFTVEYFDKKPNKPVTLKLVYENNFKLILSSEFKRMSGLTNFLNPPPTIPKKFYKYLVDSEDRKTAQGSNKRLKCICPNCKIEKTMVAHLLVKNGFKCKACSKHTSFPERFVSHYLKELKISFETEKIFLGSRRRYDFYIPDFNMVIETHGRQHYEPSFAYSKNTKNNIFLQQQKIDREKRKFCEEKNIKYIEIDCRESSVQYITNSINNTVELPKINQNLLDKIQFNISEIENYNIELIKKKVKSGSSFKEIAKELDLHPATVSSILKRIGYNPKKIVCLTTMTLYNSASEASVHMGVKGLWKHMRQHTRGKLEYLGRHPNSFKKLKWMYYEDYIEKYDKSQLKIYSEKTLSYTEENGLIKKIGGRQKPVVCVNTKTVFSSIKTVCKIFNISAPSIQRVLSNKQKNTGKHNITKEGLKWMYYEDYIEKYGVEGLVEYTQEDNFLADIIKPSDNSKQVVCVNSKIFFQTMGEATAYINYKKSSVSAITRACKHRKTAGKHPVTGEKLKWMYYEDYVEKYGTEGLTEYVEEESHN